MITHYVFVFVKEGKKKKPKQGVEKGMGTGCKRTQATFSFGQSLNVHSILAFCGGAT